MIKIEGASVVLVSCSSMKASAPSPARDLYTSPLFRKSLAYALSDRDAHVYIMSAEHGLLPLDRVIAPYNRKLHDLGKMRRMWWGINLVDQLAARYAAPQLVLLGGEEYCSPIRGAAKRLGWPDPQMPLDGMNIGQRLRWLTMQLGHNAHAHVAKLPNPTIAPTKTKRSRQPYVTQRRCTTYGWIMELFDPSISDRASQMAASSTKKFTREDKHALLVIYNHAKEKSDV